MEKVPEPARVSNRREIAELGVTVVTYANGVEAWFKPTDFKNDQVLFSLTAPGGSSLAAPEKYPEAQLATAQIGLSGVGGHNAVELQKLLAGKIASASPFISLSTQGISGSSTPANLETGLQLLNLNFTAPGDDPEAFSLIKRQLEASYANRDRSPNIAFGEKLAQVNTMGHYTSKPLTLERIAALDRGAMTSFYRERFSNAADFTFFMVGTFKVDEAVPLVARYVGSLPSTGRPSSQVKDVGIKFPPATERASVAKGREPKSLVAVSFSANSAARRERAGKGRGRGRSAGDRAAGHPARGAGRNLQRVRRAVAAAAADGRWFHGRQLRRGAGESRQDDRPRPAGGREAPEDGPSPDLTNRAKESARRAYETSVKQNGFWLGRLQSAKLLGRDPLLILHRPERIEHDHAGRVAGVGSRRYFPLDRYTVVTLTPER